jgi:hypothetical protein
MTFERDHGLYDTSILWALSEENERTYMPVSQLKHFLDVWLWQTGTPNQVIQGVREDDENHLKRMENADMSYPIILSNVYPPNIEIEIPGEIDLLDGLHRLAKAVYLLKLDKILVVFVTTEQLDLARIE